MKKDKPFPIAIQSDHIRWLIKARRCFTMKDPCDKGLERQRTRALDLARDIWRTLDPEGWKKPH
jgi:hypothetical protein